MQENNDGELSPERMTAIAKVSGLLLEKDECEKSIELLNDPTTKVSFKNSEGVVVEYTSQEIREYLLEFFNTEQKRIESSIKAENIF